MVRTILTELQRIASHLVWLGTHALDIGALTPVFYCFREREEILKIFEKYCGARLTTHAFRIGGLQYETYDGFEEEVKRFCVDFEHKIDEYSTLLTENRIWVGRTKGVGILSAADAIALGVSGPVLRASGVNWDIRKAMPYAAYDQYNLKFPLPNRVIHTTVISCAWRRCASRAGFACRPSKIFPPDRSWRVLAKY